MAQIRLVNLSKRYGAVPALDGITLTVSHGELLALLGPSGCGKTTTLQILAGFLMPDAGEVWADDRVISHPGRAVPPERRRMSLVFQSYALWPHMTVSQNVAFGLELRRMARDEIARHVTRILRVVDLDGYQDRYPHELSGGQQQRVALARALVVQPDTLLLDEPLSNLDATLREHMRFEIRRIHRETGITTIYVTHDQAEAMVIADRVAVMYHGRIEQVGTPREIYDAPQSRFVASFIGLANCLRGRLAGRGVIRCGDLEFRVADSGGFHTGDEAVLCVRPHAVCVRSADSAASPAVNAVVGRLVQQAYLGGHHDLRIVLSGGEEVRAMLPGHAGCETGTQVVVEFPVEACRLVRP